MRKVILLNVLLIGLLVATSGFATFAWYTSQASSVDNVFTSGELIIGVPYLGENDGFISMENFYPGASVTDTVNVKNLGSMNFKYKVSSLRSDGDEVLYNELDLKIKKGEELIYDGKLKDLDKFVGNIDSGNSETLEFTVTLPTTAGNECQGKMAFAKFDFDATQIENPIWD